MPVVHSLVRPCLRNVVASYGVVTAHVYQAIFNQAAEESFYTDESRLASLFFARMVDVVYTDVAGNASPTLALTNRIV